MNVDRTGDPRGGVIAAGDALCHTDPAFAYGFSFSLAHAQALASATACAPERRGGLDANPGRRSCPRRGALPVACTMLDRTAALDPSGAPGVRASRARRHERANLSHRDRQAGLRWHHAVRLPGGDCERGVDG